MPIVWLLRSSGLLMSWRVVMVHCDLRDSPTMYMILPPLSAACAPPDGIGAQSRVAGKHRGDLGGGLQFHQAGIEAFVFEEALIERHIGRNVEAIAADHLADRD